MIRVVKIARTAVGKRSADWISAIGDARQSARLARLLRELDVTEVLDLGLLPPEVNSARRYSGAHSGPLAAQLRSTALSYGAVLSALTEEEWLGPASVFESTATRVVESARNQLADAARGASNVAATR